MLSALKRMRRAGGLIYHRRASITLRATQYSTTTSLQSGHNKWSTIKHDKGRNDARKSKERSIIVEEIVLASSLNGPDPSANTRLAQAIASAKRAGTSKASIDAAIARGQGRSATGQALESMLIEAVIPPVAIIVDCMTDSKARTLSDVRYLIKQAGGTATPTKYLFEKRGRIVFRKCEGMNADKLLEPALEAGALDVTTDAEGRIVVDTEATSVKSAESQLVESTGLEIAASTTTWIPNAETMVKHVDEKVLEAMVKLNDDLHGCQGVEQIKTNLDLDHLPEDARVRLEN